MAPIHIGSIIGLNRLLGQGGPGLSGPCLTGLLSNYDFTWDTDSVLLDQAATGTHDAIPGKYLYIDVVGYSITFAAMGAGVTLTSHGGTATCSLTSGTLTCSVAGTLHTIVLSDGTKYSCGESVGTLIAPDVAGINGTLVGFTLPTDRISKATEGKSWNEASFVVADGGGTFDSGAYLPASYTSEGTLYTGSARNPLTVKGYALTGDGSAYATAASHGLEVAGGRIDVDLTYYDGLGNLLLIDLRDGVSGNGFLYLPSTDKFEALVGTGTLVSSVDILSTGTDYTLSLRWDGSLVKTYIDDVEKGSETQVGAAAFGSIVYFGISNTGGNRINSNIKAVRFYSAAGVLVDHWIFQAANTGTQGTAFNVVGSSNAILTDHTTPAFTAEVENSWLAHNGGTVNGVNIVPGVENSTLDAEGNPKGFNLWSVPADVLIFNYAEVPNIVLADATNNQLINLTTGLAEDIDPTDIIDTDTIITGTLGQALTSEAQTGACLAQTEAAVGK